eukprot:CAMPEP_0198497220 /NCGR_PEP_ID=MMETSP1462-20131121/6274_1 /TAXON_ID=1333877 /ORGANISM="Brandtodinium nutriculum, Strain RCC3387" /LENGTH=178 /DNA_ID=CAMNT_0044226079 /DNA_START=98 /DNA_END=631 /DNA_ORIENTATION=+
MTQPHQGKENSSLWSPSPWPSPEPPDRRESMSVTIGAFKIKSPVTASLPACRDALVRLAKSAAKALSESAAAIAARRSTGALMLHSNLVPVSAANLRTSSPPGGAGAWPVSTVVALTALGIVAFTEPFKTFDSLPSEPIETFKSLTSEPFEALKSLPLELLETFESLPSELIEAFESL